MAADKEEIIFELKVEPGDAISDMEKLKKSILQTKEEQKGLNKALKDGNITLDEYVSDSVRLENILKKQQGTYNDLSRSVTGQKNVIKELTKSNQELSKQLKITGESFKDVAGNINVAGVNVGSLTTKLASFANPATAAVGIVTALSAVYARSTIGAKDLAFAQNQLNAAITIGSNAFANLISSAKDGEGLFSKITNAILYSIDPTTAALSKLSALNQEKLSNLGNKEIEIRDNINHRLEENQELLSDIGSDQVKLNDKLNKGDLIITNIRRNEEDLKAVLSDELSILQDQLKIDSENSTIQTAILQKKREISNVERDAEKSAQAIVRLQSNLIDAEAKRLKLADEKATSDKLKNAKQGFSIYGSKTGDDFRNDSKVKTEIDSAKYLNNALKTLDQQKTDNEIQSRQQGLEFFKYVEDQKLQIASDVAGSIAGLFGRQTAAYKLFASAQTIISTYSSATKSYDSLAGIPYIGPALGAAAAAAAIAAGLANLAQINGVQIGGKAAGGGDFVTSGPTMLMVGDNPGGKERVTVEPLSGKGQTVVYPNSNLVKMAGGGSLTTGDGGFSLNSMTSETNQNLMVANAMKRTPKTELSVKEVSKIQKRVKARELI